MYRPPPPPPPPPPSSSSPWSSEVPRPNFNHQNNHYHQHSNHFDSHFTNFNNYNNHYVNPPPHCNNPRQEFPQQHYAHGGICDNNGGGRFRFNGGTSMPHSGQKRFRYNSNGVNSPDHVNFAGHVKLYVAQVPRTSTEELIRPVFQEHGNIVEIVILKDKLTGQQQGSCFVKYSTSEEADRAIRALDERYTFPGEVMPIKVKYADGKRERLSSVPITPPPRGVLEKLYVGGLNKDTTPMDIEEVFSPYGLVEDIFIVRNELKQSRGCGFVQFSRRDMAHAAIKALNGTFIMKGCDQPLIVRFAEPKKSRIGEQRGNSMTGNLNFIPRPREPDFRPENPPGDLIRGHMPNNCMPVQPNLTIPRPRAVSQIMNLAPGTQQPFPPPQEFHSQFAHISSEQTKVPQIVSQSPHPVFTEMQKEIHQAQPTQYLHQQQNIQVKEPQSSLTGCNPHTVSSTSSSPVVPLSPKAASSSSLDCDWSEHTCPDGNKYYYNCETCESRWEKPEEFASFQQQLQKQQKLQNPIQRLNSHSPVVSPKEEQLQTHFFPQKLQLQQPSSAPSELVHVQPQTIENLVISPTCG